MVKIQSRAGASLADVYDVQGSISGIDQLETRELPIVHEMGATVFSERFASAIRRIASNNVLQSVEWDVEVTNLPAGITRILSVAVFAGKTARVSHAAAYIRDPASGREVPFWAWDSAVDGEVKMRIQDNDGVVADAFLLQPAVPMNVPGMIIKQGTPPQQVPDIALRGASSAFGAGNVTTIMVLQLAFTHVGGISSIGLPVPSW